MIRVKNLTKEYGGRGGIRDISLEIRDGEVFGLLGPRGSGKTTLLSVLGGFASPEAGGCWINGKVPGQEQEKLVRSVGCLTERLAFPADMTAVQYLRFLGAIRGRKNLERGLSILRRFDIAPEKKLGKLRRGQRRLVGLACAMAHEPGVLILDEPDRHLDPMMHSRLDALILEEKAKRTTMLIASENYTDMERVCDRIGLIRRGSLVQVDDASSMRRSRKKTYLVSFQSEMEALRFMRENPGMKQVSTSQVLLDVTGEIRPSLKLLGNYQVTGLELMTEGLEEIFSHFYGGQSHA